MAFLLWLIVRSGGDDGEDGFACMFLSRHDGMRLPSEVSWYCAAGLQESSSSDDFGAFQNSNNYILKLAKDMGATQEVPSCSHALGQTPGLGAVGDTLYMSHLLCSTATSGTAVLLYSIRVC